MAKTTSLLGALLFSSPLASAAAGTGKGDFSYVQPLNTTILGAYGHSPPVYPSPNATGSGGWEEALDKAKAFAAKLTTEEKAQMVTGAPGPCVGNILAIPRVGFGGLCLQDGPLAIRLADYASVFPAGVTIASSWNRTAIRERGQAMAREFRAKGAHIYLGPVAGPLGRSAYAGRNWEGFAADPYLTGVAMEETIEGVQGEGVQAVPKHFIANEQETQRNPTFSEAEGAAITDVEMEALSANLDDRTMHELYLWPFANSVRARAASIMCSYQRINGSYGCENSKTLNGLLKTELGFQGYVQSDWGATHSGVASIEAGLDMDMPGGLGLYGFPDPDHSFFGANVTTAVNNGTLDASRLDDMVIRIMTPYYHLGQDAADYPTVDPSTVWVNGVFPNVSTWIDNYSIEGPSSRDVRGDHGDLIRRHAAESTILLKNTDGALPLGKPKVYAVFGSDAGEPTNGYANLQQTEFGTLAVGGGSGTGRYSYLVTPLDAIKARARRDGAIVQPFLNNTLVAGSDLDKDLLWIPRKPDVCLVFLKTYAEEAADRTNLELDHDGAGVVESVASKCPNTVVVTHSSGINVLPFADHPNVTAILAAHYPGQETGNSIADVLFGDVNPSGRLPYTIALDAADYNAPPTTEIRTTGREDWQSWFDEGLEIDYRHFDAAGKDVRYEFGFGLSYSTFALGDLTTEAVGGGDSEPVTSEPAEDRPVQPGGNPALWDSVLRVTVPVTNTGDVAGATVAQLYVGFPEGEGGAPAGTPPRQLRGFDKVHLEPGETRDVAFDLARRDLSYWDAASQRWLLPAGAFRLSAGFSSRDLPSEVEVTVVQG